MADYSENYLGKTAPQPCPICGIHIDSQSMCLECPTIKDNVKIEGTYSHIFSDRVETKLANTLVKVDKFRNEYIQSRKLR